jgi:hypothetical protein
LEIGVSLLQKPLQYGIALEAEILQGHVTRLSLLNAGNISRASKSGKKKGAQKQ